MALAEYRFTDTPGALGRENAPLERFASIPPQLAAGSLPRESAVLALSPRAYTRFKRAMDLVLTGALLVLLSPILAVIACAIWAEDRGPILFCQERTGRDGKPFRFYKFRSMVANAEALKEQLAAQNEATGPIFKMRDDPRITRVGRLLRRFSLDELPQLLHVLRGEMSLVGPRPLPVVEAMRCTRVEQRRHSVQPGLLCFREVSGRSRLSFDRWMELDLRYIERRSLRTDFSILLSALPAVLKGDGAY